MKLFLIHILILLPLMSFSQADSSKSDYHLFKPTPKLLMRGFETDRPDITESSYTVDAGHFQVETDIFKIEKNKTSGVQSSIYSYNLANVKLGLNNLTDIQFVINSLETEVINSSLSKQKSTQFGGITVRVKRNIWGNDIGKTALAIMPFVNVPFRKGEGKITGGLIVPFSLSLANDWGFGAQIQADAIENENSSGYHLNYLASATLAHSLFKNCNFFVESYITKETEINLFEYFFNTGLVYELGEHLKLDGGINYGIKQSSSKVYFIGLSFRY